MNRCSTAFRPHFLLFIAWQVAASLAVGGDEATSSLYAADEVSVATRDALQRAVENARPGARIVVAPGVYKGGIRFLHLRGAADKPIVIAGADPADPPVFQGGAAGLHLTAPQFVELHDLAFAGASGNGLNIDDGSPDGRNGDSTARHLVLRNIQVRDVGPQGNRDGIKLSGVDHFRIENCRVERWGRSGSAIDLVGCHVGVIQGCTFREQPDAQANGVQTKGGSSKIQIQHCRFHDAGGRAVNLGGSTGLDYFRPRDARCEAHDVLVEDCTFIGSMSPVAFVGVDGAVVRRNTFYRPARWLLRILQESRGERFTPCQNGVFEANLVVFRGDELRSLVNVGEGTRPDTFSFAGNHWHCLDAPARSQRYIDLPTPEQNGRYAPAPKFIDEASLDLRLAPDSPVRDVGARAP